MRRLNADNHTVEETAVFPIGKTAVFYSVNLDIIVEKAYNRERKGSHLEKGFLE